MFKDILYYKSNLQEVITRYQRLYAIHEPGHILVYAIPPFNPPEPPPPLNQVNFDQDLYSYLNIFLRNYEAQIEQARPILDDLIPSFGLFFGIGDYSAFIAGDVIFTPDTSWAAPVIHDWSDLDKLELREDNYWEQLLEHTITYIKQFTLPAPIPIVRGFYSPLDMAHALRGEALFTDFYDSPEQVNRLMQFSPQAVIWNAHRLRALIGEYFNGDIAGAWLPPGTICMSEDIACMISPRTYAKFARPYTQQVIDAFGNGQIHTHSLGLRVIPEITMLNNLVGLQISDDPNTTRAFDQLDDLLPKVHGVPITVGCNPSDIHSSITDLSSKYPLTFAAFVEC
jgi:hypothetical protein